MIHDSIKPNANLFANPQSAQLNCVPKREDSPTEKIYPAVGLQAEFKVKEGHSEPSRNEIVSINTRLC